MQFTAFDMSGQNRYRNLWEHYFKDAEAIVFVVDSTDRIRFVVAKNELDAILESPELQKRKARVLAESSLSSDSIAFCGVIRRG